MDSKELYVSIAANRIAISEALALAMAYIPLTQEERLWVERELNGYNNKLEVPEYRQIPCEVKARVQNIYSSIVRDTRLGGGPMKELDKMLNEKLGLSIFKMYVGQGVESIEKQIADHNDGDVIMIIDGPPGEELRNSIKSLCQSHYCAVRYVFQTAPIAYMKNTLFDIKNRIMGILQSHFTEKTMAPQVAAVDKKIIFISYCWEDEEHKNWVKKLAKDLSELFTVKIDQELPYGVELTQFMEQAIASSDKVLIITTPEYKHRADNRIRGVGYETSLITDDLVTDQNRIKFIPVIRKGTRESSYPRYLGTRKGADMTDDLKYTEMLEDIKNNLLSF